MKLNPPKNPNYAATVVQVTKLSELEGCDNVVGTPLLGYQAIVSKATKLGDIGVVFTAETQLSHDYAARNDLYRHPENNKNPEHKGYLEDNRRVKAIKFRGHRSDALFMPLESLEYTGIDLTDLKAGDSFDELNGHEICQKYEIKTRTPGQKNVHVTKSRVDDKFFKEHLETENYFRNLELIPGDIFVTVTQKLHGTSARYGRVPVRRELTVFERIFRYFGVKVQETEYAFVSGSRRMIKSVRNS